MGFDYIVSSYRSDNTICRKATRGGSLIGLTFPDLSSPLKEVRAGSEAKTKNKMLLTGSCSFLTQSRTTCLGMVLPRVGRALLQS